MAIATIERDPARDSGTSDLRFRLLQEVCRTPEASFWRAHDRRSGKSCVVRVIDADREESSRRLGDLHRERTLAERIGHPGVMRCDVPLIEADRIFQLVDPEPARTVDLESEGGRLALLTLLVGVAAVLADAHGRGVFHGAFSRVSCLRTDDGRVIVQGFRGDAPSPAAVREGVAADHRAFLEFATEMLRHTGGPPPRLRRYFTQHLGADAPKPSATPLADLGTDLRESLEDTFPWPLAGSPPEVGPLGAPAPNDSADSPTLTLEIPRGMELPTRPVKSKSKEAPKPRPAAKAATEAVASESKRALVRGDAGSIVLRLDSPVRRAAATGAATAASAAIASPPDFSPVRAARRDLEDEDTPPTRSLRPWLVAAVVIVILGATIQFAGKSRRPAASSPAPVTAPTAAVAPTEPVADAPPVVAAQPDRVEAKRPKVAAPPEVRRSADPPPRERPPATTGSERSTPVVASRTAVVRVSVVRTAPAVPVASITPDAQAIATAPDAASPQATRSRVATLVSGGTRALNALEPSAAAEAFAAALALAPNDRAAQEGSQRARRLQGVAALVRDARDAGARGDYARAVQGYSQALSNDPRNRGLADALAAARRNVGRDATGTLLAEGHAALGAGRLEAARAAFEKALESDPLAPGARRAAEQAATAILLRDEAESRRAGASPTTAKGSS